MRRAPIAKRYVIMDAYAMDDLAREISALTANAGAGQFFIGARIWRTEDKEWTGTFTEVAESTRISRNTVSKLVATLAELGLIVIVVDFGPNGQGTIRVPCYERFIRPPAENRGNADTAETPNSA